MKTLLSYVFATSLLFISSSFAFAAETGSPKAAPETTQIQETININTADVETLTSLKGIGSKKAEAILAWRQANGNFQTVDQLMEVKGIGAAILDANREKLRVQ